MYFWKIDALVEDLRLDKVSQKEEFKYLLFFLIFQPITLFNLPDLSEALSSRLQSVFVFVNLAMFLGFNAYGLYRCFNVNHYGDDKNFIARVLCLSVPINIRLGVIFFLIFQLLVSLLVNFGGSGSVVLILYTFFHGAFIAVYYWYLAVKIKEVSDS